MTVNQLRRFPPPPTEALLIQGDFLDTPFFSILYPEARDALQRLIRRLTDAAGQRPIIQPPHTGLRALMMPHAGYAFYRDEPMLNQTDNRQPLTAEQGAALVTLARQTLADHFGETAVSADGHHLETRLADQVLQARCGTFVTLKMDDQLRGCIGSLSATVPIVSGVRDNALNAAFHDPRFSPLCKRELDRVQIEVSVLSEPVPLTYTDSVDLLTRLRPGVDGVIIKKGIASATFLPQVWEQLPQPEPFLSHLCMKAGLPADGWREGDLTVLVYQVQYFEEAR